MQEKEANIKIAEQSSQIQITVPANSKLDFNNHLIRQQLTQVKLEVKAVLDGAHVDAKKLSLNFTV